VSAEPAGTPLPWSAAVATGIGSYPGQDPVETLRVVLGELPDMPHLPELPARGAGADMIGRSAALLVDLAAGLQPSGWRFVDAPGRDQRRALDFLARDLDTLEELAGEYEGPLKVQVAGPWTLAGAIELRHGDKALADPGAVRDVTDSLAEGIARHLADVARRVPHATVIAQLDEPGLPGVLAGTVPTASGFGRLAAVEEPIAAEGLGRVLAKAGPVPIVHCCAPDVPYDLLRVAGARAISVDLAMVGQDPREDEAIGTAIEAGVRLFLGAVPVPLPDQAQPQAQASSVARRIHDVGRRLGFGPEWLAKSVVVTPACGLAGAEPAAVRPVLDQCRDIARILREDEPLR
jgi:hypothetical protein